MTIDSKDEKIVDSKDAKITELIDTKVTGNNGGKDTEKRRIGVYICHCGGNISDYVDVKNVVNNVKDEEGVIICKDAMFTCSDATQQEMIDDIKKNNLDGLVVASCSPKLHLFTFRGAAERASLNPYQYVQSNIREQCSWCHSDNMKLASDKATRLVRAAIAKAALTEPLDKIRIDTIPKTLVIGGGVSGLRSAIALADLGFGVFVVEKEDKPGGWVGKVGKVFPNNENGPDLIKELLEEIKKRDNITLFNGAELVEKSGSVGNFNVKIRLKNKEAVSVEVGAILVATGFDPYTPSDNEFSFKSDRVVTLPQFREIMDSAKGEIQFKGKAVKDIVYIYCVGSRGTGGTENKYCSRYCCTAGVHTGTLVNEISEDINQYHLFRDMRTYGKYEIIYDKACCEGSLFAKFPDDKPPVVIEDGERMKVTLNDSLTNNEDLEISADLVVLVTGMVPRENAALIDVLKLPVSKCGFFNEIHPKLRPVETVIDGVYIAGSSQGPKNISESIAASLSAVSKSAGLLLKGYVDLEPTIAVVDESACEWCDACTNVCAYSAITKEVRNGKEVAVINKSLCKGEGACIPVCPNNALDLKGCSDEMVKSMVDAFLKEV
jgi:heterodisulfide reductase subunit A